MSISILIHGIRDGDGILDDMVALKLMCDKLNIPYPAILAVYFGASDALDMSDAKEIKRAAQEVDLRDLKIEGLIQGECMYDDGAIVDLEKLPDDITKLRIWAS